MISQIKIYHKNYRIFGSTVYRYNRIQDIHQSYESYPSIEPALGFPTKDVAHPRINPGVLEGYHPLIHIGGWFILIILQGGTEIAQGRHVHMGVNPKIMGNPPKSSILIIGCSIIFTIHFGVPLIFGNTHIYTKYITTIAVTPRKINMEPQKITRLKRKII